LEEAINIHIPGRGGLDKPALLVFPKIVVCLDCGVAESPFKNPSCVYQGKMPRRIRGNVMVGVDEADSSGIFTAHGQVGGVNIGEISYGHIKVSSRRSWSLILP
jgi:hypothetical protein